MDTKTADNFFANSEWFNQFYQDLSALFDKASQELGQTLHYEESANRWYPKARELPSMPDRYHAFYAYKDAPQMVMAALLMRPANKRIALKEPTLMVIVHGGGENVSNGVAMNVIDGQYIKTFSLTDDKAAFRGELTWDVHFRGLLVPLDAFSDKNYADTTVSEKIVEPLRRILEEDFSKSQRRKG